MRVRLSNKCTDLRRASLEIVRNEKLMRNAAYVRNGLHAFFISCAVYVQTTLKLLRNYLTYAHMSQHFAFPLAEPHDRCSIPFVHIYPPFQCMPFHRRWCNCIRRQVDIAQVTWCPILLLTSLARKVFSDFCQTGTSGNKVWPFDSSIISYNFSSVLYCGFKVI